MPISFGDIAIDATANVTVESATFNVGSLIALNTNPYTFAASVIIQVLVNIWNAAKERELLEEQIALLKQMNQKIDDLNLKADAILKRLNELPAVLLPAIRNIVRDEVKMGRLDGYYIQLDSVALQFETLKNLRISPDLWIELKSSFYGICQDEFRFQKLLILTKYTELMNFISAGKEEEYLSALLMKAAANVESFQKALSENIVNRYREAVQNVADGTNNFYPLRCDSPVFPGTVSNFSATAPHLKIAEDTKALNDLVIGDTITPEGQLAGIYSNSTIVLDSGQRLQVGAWMQGAVALINSGAAGPQEVSRAFAVVETKDFVSRNYSTRFADAIARLKTFHERVFPEIQEDIKRCRDLQELKAALRAGAKIDYGKKLKRSRSRIG